MSIKIILVCCLFISITGCDKDALAPVGTGSQYKLTTGEAGDITQTTAVMSCTLKGINTGAEISSKGVVYSTAPHPILSNLSLRTNTALGHYTVSFTNLAPGKKYYARAFAVIDFS